MIKSAIRTIVLAGSLIAGTAVLAPGIAEAQDSGWLWGGSMISGGSGRESVSLRASYPRGTIIVSFGDRRLYLVGEGGQALSYPIAIPREQSRWQGTTVVSQKRINPPWMPTPTMRAENPRLPTFVPGGHPMNPLGVRALYLGASAYRIHGTDAPWTIGQNVSKGCVRMFNQDVIDLYGRVNVGTRVVVTWQRFQTGAGVASSDEPVVRRKRYARAPVRSKSPRHDTADAAVE